MQKRILLTDTKITTCDDEGDQLALGLLFVVCTRRTKKSDYARLNLQFNCCVSAFVTQRKPLESLLFLHKLLIVNTISDLFFIL